MIEVVVRQGHVTLEGLAAGIRFSREQTMSHPDGQVVSLDAGGRAVILAQFQPATRTEDVSHGNPAALLPVSRNVRHSDQTTCGP